VIWRRVVDWLGLVPVGEVDDLHHRLIATEFERDEARIRLAQSERAFAHQSMAFSRRYEALEANVLQGVSMRQPASFFLGQDGRPLTAAAAAPPPMQHGIAR
jgi:hypothetical protein